MSPLAEREGFTGGLSRLPNHIEWKQECSPLESKQLDGKQSIESPPTQF